MVSVLDSELRESLVRNSARSPFVVALRVSHISEDPVVMIRSLSSRYQVKTKTIPTALLISGPR